MLKDSENLGNGTVLCTGVLKSP